MGTPGFTDGVNTLSDVDRLLASTIGVKKRGAVLDAATVDANSELGTQHLRRGLLLGKITASGKYAQYNSVAVDGTQLSADAVVLAENIDVENAVDPQVAVYHAAALHSDVVYGDLAGLTLADVQRLEFVLR